MISETILETDILVIGGGMAGIFAAVKSKEKGLDVVLVDKGTVGRSGLSPFARGFHYFDEKVLGTKEDFIEGSSIFGEYLNNRTYLKGYCDRSKAAYEDLASWGLFGKIKYADAILPAVKKAGVHIIKRTMITDLIVQDNKVVGAVGFPMEGNRFIVVKAKAVIMCAGAGAFKPSGFPVSSLTSDGDAMAYRVGAEISGKEFVDTHDATMKDPADCWKGWGTHWSDGIQPGWAELERNLSLERPMGKIFDIEPCRPELIKPEKIEAGGAPAGRGFTYHNGGWAPMPRAPYPKPAMPGPDQSKGPVETTGSATAGLSVHKAEGIWPVDDKCSSNIPGLFAAGDALGSIMFGTVYSVGGGSVSGSAVQGVMASEGAAEYVKNMEIPDIPKADLEKLKKLTFEPRERAKGYSPAWVTRILQNAMIPAFVLYIKTEEWLKAALTTVEHLRDQYLPKLTAKEPHDLRLAHETKNMILNAEMKLRASLLRTESRGNHFREDYPARDDENWLAWITIKNEGGKMKLTKVPVPEEWRPDPSTPYEERYPFRFPGELEFLGKNSR